MYFHFTSLLLLVFGCFTWPRTSSVFAAPNNPEAKPLYFDQSSPIESSQGHGLISWKGWRTGWSAQQDEPVLPSFEVQLDSGDDFHSPSTIYAGSDSSTFLSGLENGDYFLRARWQSDDANGAWSEPLLLRVRHESLTLALVLFTSGLLMFCAICAVIIYGNIHYQEDRKSR